MTPTNELRFVERWIGEQQKWVRVLQQKWEDTGGYGTVEEWRDVPCVKENT